MASAHEEVKDDGDRVGNNAVDYVDGAVAEGDDDETREAEEEADGDGDDDHEVHGEVVRDDVHDGGGGRDGRDDRDDVRDGGDGDHDGVGAVHEVVPTSDTDHRHTGHVHLGIDCRRRWHVTTNLTRQWGWMDLSWDHDI